MQSLFTFYNAHVVLRLGSICSDASVITCDHRVVDGAIGARFLQAFKALIEDPLTMIV